MSKDRRLGRGLAALLGNPTESDLGGTAVPTDQPSASSTTAESPAVDSKPANSSDNTADGVNHSDPQSELPVDKIDPNPFQPRLDFDEKELQELAASLRTHRLLQPIVVRQVGERFQLIYGERRWRAAMAAGWTRIPAQIRDADDREASELAIVENLLRKDLGAIEKARCFHKYLQDNQATQEELANRLQIDRSTIANLLRLLELPPSVQQAVQAQKLTAGHARALLTLGDTSLQEQFSMRAIAEGWSVRETERQVQSRVKSEDESRLTQLDKKASQLGIAAKNRQTEALERELKMALGARVEIRQSGKKSGKIVIHFDSPSEFGRVHQLLVDGRITKEAA